MVLKATPTLGGSCQSAHLTFGIETMSLEERTSGWREAAGRSRALQGCITVTSARLMPGLSGQTSLFASYIS
jgi:hypothetical protein